MNSTSHATFSWLHQHIRLFMTPLKQLHNVDTVVADAHEHITLTSLRLCANRCKAHKFSLTSSWH